MTQTPQTPPTSLDQLRRALDAGLIDQSTFDAAAAAIIAQLEGSGAIAHGPGAVAVGAAGASVGRDNYGPINTGVIIQLGTRPGASGDDLRRAYLARLLTQADQLPLFAGDGGKAQVRLSSVYTALQTQRCEAEGIVAQVARHFGVTDEREVNRLSALDVLNLEKKLVFLGGPGSGKSTFVSFVALSMAGELLGIPAPNLATLTAPLPQEEAQREEPRPQQWDHGALLPVHIVLRDLASQLPKPGVVVNAETVWRHICERLKQAALEDYAPHLRDHLCQQGGLVLFDGLDEVPDADSRREQIKHAVQDFAASFGKCRLLVTSRTYAYQRQEWKLDDFSSVELLPFTPAQIHWFVDAWYAHMAQLGRLLEGDARGRAEVLKQAVGRNRHVAELSVRPLLLTLIAKVQTEKGGALPEKREELYDKAVDMLLNEWEGTKVRLRADGSKDCEPSLAEWLNAGREDVRKQLNRLAFEAHRDQPMLAGTADIRQQELIAALLEASASSADVKVKRLEEYLRDRAGILAAHGVGMYQFPHRSFQEYLAACYLTDDDFPDKLAELARGDPNRWREVALLAGAKAARGSTLNAWTLAETLCVAPPPDGAAAEADHWGALLAGRVLVECADLAKVAPRNADKLARIRDWQRAIMRRNTLPAVERALAGRTLAVLGDPRPEVMSLDGMQFCCVPPGPFVMGDDSNEDEKPQHRVDLAHPYLMARFPVTVAQWREYVQLSGYTPQDENSLRGRDNDPVVFVGWREALRFCDFLTEAWRGLLPEGWLVTLPSEAEWEKAARGGERVPADYQWVTAAQARERLEALIACVQMPNPFPTRDYPWGHVFDADEANVAMNIGEISAVGGYPVGHSPYCCEEMSGNVWEWTCSLWGKDWQKSDFNYPYQPLDGKREDLSAGEDIWRVVRGGSWLDGRGDARCAFRYGLRPDGRFSLFGFRVVLRSAPARSGL